MLPRGTNPPLRRVVMIILSRSDLHSTSSSTDDLRPGGSGRVWSSDQLT